MDETISTVKLSRRQEVIKLLWDFNHGLNVLGLKCNSDQTFCCDFFDKKTGFRVGSLYALEGFNDEDSISWDE